MNPNDAAMAGLINGLPPAPSNPAGNAGDIFGQPAQPLFGPPAAPAPGYAPAPAAAPYYPPTPPPAPAPQYVAPGYAPAPGAPVSAPPVPALPAGPLDQYPVGSMPLQVPQGEQIPAWAQELVQSVQELQTNQPGAPSGDPNDWPDRPTTWGGLKQTIQQTAQQIADERVKAYIDAAEDAKKKDAAALEEGNKQIDFAVGQLRQTGMLPVVTNPNDPNDPGRMAERELVGYTLAMGGSSAQHLVQAAPALRAHHDAGYYYDFQRQTLVRRGSQSAAASAPIAGGAPVMGVAGGGAPAAPSQSELGMPLDQLMQIGMNRIQ